MGMGEDNFCMGEPGFEGMLHALVISTGSL